MKKRTRIVPSLVVTASFVGVIPMCALEACGGTTSTQDGGGDATNDQFLGVAAVAMCCFEASLPDGDASDANAEASDAPSDTTTDVTTDVIGDSPSDAKEGGG